MLPVSVRGLEQIAHDADVPAERRAHQRSRALVVDAWEKERAPAANGAAAAAAAEGKGRKPRALAKRTRR